MNRKIRGRLFLIIGCLFILVATGLFIFYDYQDAMAGQYSRELLEEYLEHPPEYHHVAQNGAPGEMLDTNINGYAMAGIIQIPKVNIQLPVLNQWSYELLQIAPCRYSGSINEGNLIILGHNYKSHFTPLKQCQKGDKVEFYDVNNQRYVYKIKKIQELHKTELDKLTSEEYDLTIFTCTYGGQSRFVARCKMVKGKK